MRQIIETVLELVGLVLLVAAAAVWAGAAVALPLGLAVAGAGLIGVSAASGVLGRPRTRGRTR